MIIRTIILILFFLLTGCFGILLDYPKRLYPPDQARAISDYYATGQLDNFPCTLSSLSPNEEMYLCAQSKKWGYLTIAFGLAIPIPYYRFTNYILYLYRNKQLVEISYISTERMGYVCGIVPHHDVVHPGCTKRLLW